MPNAQVRRRGAYAPLAATYFMDDDVMEAGEEAELLYVRGLAFCAGNPASDGYITDKQVARVVGAGMPLLAERIQALVSVGLWERLPGGYAVRSWLKWNKSADELGRHRARDRDRKSASSSTEGGSEGGAEPEPERYEDGADVRADSADVPHGTETEVGSDSTPPSGGTPLRTPDTDDLDSVPLTQHNTTQHDKDNNPPPSPAAPATKGEVDLFGEVVEGEIVTDIPNQRRASDWDNVDLNIDPDFRAFWDAYPRKVDKGHARKAWLTVMKKGGVDPSVIIAGAIRYRNDPDRKPDIKFTAHPATWLNGERWADYDEADVVMAGNPEEWWNN